MDLLREGLLHYAGPPGGDEIKGGFPVCTSFVGINPPCFEPHRKAEIAFLIFYPPNMMTICFLFGCVVTGI